jgi:signal transduction histidine kinase/HPt (histidine-containing phosphotransfer) domain-containing protein
MRTFADRTLDQKLSAMVALAGGLTLAFAVLIFAGTAIFGAYQDLQNRLIVLADAIAVGSRASFTGSDPNAGVQTMQALQAESQVMSGALHRADGGIVASYESAPRAGHEDNRERIFATLLGGLFDRHVEIEQAVTIDGTVVGEVRIVADLADTWLDVERRLAIICAAAGGGYLLMMCLARRIRRSILAPVDRLAQAADRISTDNHYALRVGKDSNDEIGALIDAFNRMLAQIQARDARLERARAELEARVEARTAALQSANTRLRAEVAERARAETAARQAKETAEAAERASRAKSQFLASMSRQIRMPVSGVQGTIELLLATGLDARQQHYLQTMRRSTEALLDVFNGILDFAKAEAGSMEIEAVEFDCREIVEDVVRALTDRAAAKGLRLNQRAQRAVPAAVIGDPARLRQILLNLVGNAIKFTERGAVRIQVRVADQQGDTFVLRFEIHDTGIGIAPDAQAAIFEAFSQVESRPAEEESGSGLGLAVAKQLTQLMGGEIGVDSMPNRGSIFWFTIRVPQARREAVARAVSDRERPVEAATAKNDPPASAPVVTLEIDAIDQIRALGGTEAEQLVDKVVRLYCESVPPMLTSMQQAARKGDCVALTRAAHALKTSSHNVGAMRLAQVCRDLENAARAGSIRLDRLAALDFEFQSVMSKLKRVA